jgi:RHS repeat-associated protein
LDGLYSYTYDAEGHQASAAGVNYVYDGDGQRVEKASGTIYWYGTGGEVLTESALDGTSPVDYIYFGGRRLARVTGSTVYYYFGDHLDSARVMVQAGANTACYEGDFEPYGREHVVTGTCSQHYKFTGKERDTETQNDYFPARFFENNLGRWLSPAPVTSSSRGERSPNSTLSPASWMAAIVDFRLLHGLQWTIVSRPIANANRQSLIAKLLLD